MLINRAKVSGTDYMAWKTGPRTGPPIKVPVEKRGERAFPPPLKGKIEFVKHESSVLKGNPMNDPAARDVTVYLPPSRKTEGLPLLVMLTGFTGAGWLHFPARDRYLTESFSRQFERLMRAGTCGEAVVIAPDAVTSLGGSQYLNSSATGQYEDYVVKELVPWASERFHTDGVGLLGHSSGGYGSLVLSMRHPDTFSALLASAPDGRFEYGYMPEFPKAARAYKESGGPEKFIEKLFTDPPVSIGPTSSAGAGLDTLAMASCYSPAESEPGSFFLPFDWETGELLESVWTRWLKWDPVRMVETEEGRNAMHRMHAILLGGGTSDEWGLDLAAHSFAVSARKVSSVVEEEYPQGAHFDTWPRLLERFLPTLVDCLSVE